MNNLTQRIACVSTLLAGALLLAACHGPENTATTPVASTTLGTELDDSVITSKVRAALLGDDYVKSLDVKVETWKGEVMLSGFAGTTEQIERSVIVARAVPGVKNVNNKLSLKQGVQTVGNKLDDSVITAGVKSAMLADPVMKSGAVAVVTRKGEVQLSGFVDTDVQLTRAVEVAKGVDGVSSVVNNLSIKK